MSEKATNDAQESSAASAIPQQGSPKEPPRALSGELVAWGLGGGVNDRNQPNPAVEAREKYAQLEAYFLGDDSANNIVLSFDLGYENGYTPPILDSLADNGVKAVFFVTLDYVKQAPDIVRRIIDEGHVLANHTAKHKCLPQISEREALQDILSLHDYVLENYGVKMDWFRFPKGEFSEKTLKLAADAGYKSMFWSFAYVDWLTDAQPDSNTALNKLVSAVHPGAIYLLHAVSSTNAQIMNDFLQQLQAEGYSFVLPEQPAQQEGDVYEP